MRKQTKILLPILATFVSVSAHSGLPDEINYAPYKVEYDQLSVNVDEVTAKLTETEQLLEAAYQEEGRIKGEISRLQNSNINIQEDIERLEDERVQLNSYLNDLQKRMSQLNRRMNELQNEIYRLNMEINSENRRLEPLRERVAKLISRLELTKNQSARALQQLASANKVAKKMRKQLENLENQQRNLTTGLTQNRALLQDIDTKIGKVQGRIQTINPKIKNTKAKVLAEKEKQTALNAELTTIKEEIKTLRQTDPTNPRVRELRAALKVKSNEVKAQQEVIKTTKASLTALQQQKANLKKQKEKLASQKQTLPATIERQQTQLTTVEAQIPTKRTELVNANKKVAERRVESDQLGAEVNKIQNRLTKAENRLARESVRLHDAAAEVREREERLASANSRYADLNRDYNASSNRLNTVDREIPYLRTTLSDNRRELANLDANLQSTLDNISLLVSDVEYLRERQGDAIAVRDGKYQEYIERLDLYNAYLSDAKKIGASQTDIALRVARTDSNIDVTDKSNEVGSKVGTNKALAQAQLWSAVRAEILGYQDGYAAGYASEVDQNEGEAQGAETGTNQAINYAESVLKPKYFNQYFAEEIGSAKLKMTKSNTQIKQLSVESFVKELDNLSVVAGVEPVTQEEVNRSNKINTPIDDLMSALKRNLTDAYKEEKTLAKSSNVYLAPEQASVVLGSVDCSNVYKNLKVYLNACLAEHKKVYVAKYLREHKENFAAQYTELYRDAVAARRNANIAGNYDTHYQKMYPIAEAQGISDGKKDIYKEAFENARVQAYNVELPKADLRAQNTARTEVGTWIGENATLTIKGSSILGDDLKGGAQGTLSLNLKNISPTDLKSPAKVVITKTVNAKVATKTFYIKKAVGNASTTFEDIAFTVKADARSKQPIILEGKVYLAGGKYNNTRVETFKATATTAVNPAVTTSYDYDGSPRVVTRFRRNTLVHNFDITVSPKIESLSKGYTVKLAAVEGYEEMINLKNTEASTRGLKQGQEKDLRFKYFFPKSSRDKLVKIKATYLYNGKVIKEDILELKPH